MQLYKTLADGINIVEYEDSFAQAIADMWNASGDSWGGDASESTAAAIMATHRGGSNLNVYLAEKNGEVLGYCSLTQYFADEKALYIGLLNVRPDYHGKKLGKALVLMCVDRTIELGYPRLDIHTWAGNTQSVPLYKRCGYMWEDRTDSTHLVNFIPTVLSTPLTAPFFKEACWYEDSVRKIEVKPDGLKENKFEVFRYEWEKGEKKLAVGFERTGRQIRLVETDDFSVSFMAEHHALAFGLAYNCSFKIENKSGKPLQVRIQGKDDGNIRFPFEKEADIVGETVFEGSFFVDEVKEPQDIWRVHPCVLADVYVNGLQATFGLGIETCFPVTLAFEEQKKVARLGFTHDCYINITSTLRQPARICISPESTDDAFTEFGFKTLNVDLEAEGKTSVKTTAKILQYGYSALPMVYDIALSDGRTYSFTRPQHRVNRGLSGAFGFETDSHYIIQNGTWQLGMNKIGGYVWTNPLSGVPNGPGYPLGKLGKPYQEEFQMMRPYKVNQYRQDEDMVLEASFRSKTYPGVSYTEIFTLAATGVITRCHRVANEGETAISLSILDESHVRLGLHSILPYDGCFQKNRDGLVWGASLLDPEKIDENWVFEDNPASPCGFFWSPSVKANLRWGDEVFFEHETGLLKPGNLFQTEPTVWMGGIFKDFNDFRDYARQAYTPDMPLLTPHLDWALNDGNPFTKNQSPWTVVLKKYRSERLNGDITIKTDNASFMPVNETTFTYDPPQSISAQPAIVTLRLNLNTYDKTFAKALFSAPSNAEPVQNIQENGVLTATNGVLTFKIAPGFSDGLFSLTKDGHEWLLSRYPSREPFAWFNPFTGGIQSQLGRMGNAMVVREPITAEFCEERDCFGNVWQGLSSTVAVKEFDEFKGMRYTQYYLTLPGLPVLCHFVRLHNETGAFKNMQVRTEALFGHPDGVKNLTVSATDRAHNHYRYHVGSDSFDRSADRMVSLEAQSLTNDILYFYRNTSGLSPLYFWLDNRFASIGSGTQVRVKNGGVFVTRPMFLMLSPLALKEDRLVDLDKVCFE